MSIVFSNFLAPEQLKQVNYYTYFPVQESLKAGEKTCKLLPSDHAMYYPLDFSINPRKVISGELNFFNKVLFKNIQVSNYLPEEKIYFPEINTTNKKKCLVINLLDNCFGHSFMKLLNIKSIYEEYRNEFDFYIIVPKSLEHFLPKGFFSVISINISFAEAEKAYSLKPVIDTLKNKYEIIDFAVLDTYKSYSSKTELIDFFIFTDKEKKSPLGSKSITFYYRSDFYRTWGGGHQAKNITVFFKNIRNYFSKEVSFYVVGDKDNYTFPEWIKDKRTRQFSAQVDFEYNLIFKNSLMTIGIMGSNMLAPSLFSNMSVHLIPEHKLGNTAEEIINSNAYAMSACFENIYIYGDGQMNEYTPEMLANRLVILYYTKLAKEYKHGCVTWLKNKGEVLSQKDFFLKLHSYFDYNRAVILKTNIQNTAYDKIRRKHLIKKILDFIPIKI